MLPEKAGATGCLKPTALPKTLTNTYRKKYGLVQRQNLPKAEIHDVPEIGSPWRKLGEKEKIGIKRVISGGG